MPTRAPLWPRSRFTNASAGCAAIMLTTALAGCHYGATEVLVTLDTDVPVERAMTIRVTVLHADSDASAEPQRTFVRGGSSPDANLPGSLAVVPGEGAPRDQRVTVIIASEIEPAVPGASPTTFRRVARFAFTPRVTTSLPMYLALSCGTVTSGCANGPPEQCTVSALCEERGETCGDGGDCVPVDVMPAVADAGGVAMDASVAADANATGDAPAPDDGDGGPAIDPVVHIAAGANHVCVQQESGSVWCWGGNAFGQLGNGTLMASPRPTRVLGMTDAVDIAAGGFHSCARRVGGRVVCWGKNDSGQLGDGTRVQRDAPVPVLGSLTDAIGIAAGLEFSCAVRAAGTVACWGQNLDGQLGNGSMMNALFPATVSVISNITAITAGSNHACAVTMPGAVYCWGQNLSGQIGDGTMDARVVPTRVTGMFAANGIAANGAHSCALATNEIVGCWGSNLEGQLGDGTMTSRAAVMPVPGLVGVAGIAAGRQHSCAVSSLGRARCWGANTHGQLGDGTMLGRSIPVDVQTLTDAVQIAGGALHTCVRRATGGVACWGDNTYGQLGLGTLDAHSTPMDVPGFGGI